MLHPRISAGKIPVFWVPEEDTGTVILTNVPASLSTLRPLSVSLDPASALIDAQGAHFQVDLGNGEHLSLLELPGVVVGRPLSVLIPLDVDSLDRLEAAARFVRSLQGRSIPPDSRLTHLQRHRARHMLEAFDARRHGATYREIANGIYGIERVAKDYWKTSALRDAVMAMVRDGFALVAGGYRSLLRRRRRR